MQKKEKNVRYLPHLLIVAFVFILYANTLTNDYALDDLLTIKGNAFTAKGFAGIGDIFSYDSFTGFFGKQKKLVAGGRYRPLSIASFAVEYGLFGGFRPAISHFLNIVFYALTALILFIILKQLIRPEKNKHKPWYITIPFITTLLFLAHPIHTEVVANIKGRDEIFALLFSLLALKFTIDSFDGKKMLNALGAAFFFFLGLLSKENTITFLFVIPATVYFFTGKSWKQNLQSALPLVGAAILFIYIRFLVLGYFNSSDVPAELLNNPFLGASGSQKAGVIILTLGVYLRLLFFPHPLTHDYNPYQIPLVPLTDARVIISLVLYLVLIILAIVLIRKKHPVSYGILVFLSTLFIVSNIVFPVGTFMNERFLYMPSLGFALIGGWFFTEIVPGWIKKEKESTYVVSATIGLILIFFSVKTIARNPVWKDDFTLFTTDVKVSVNSTKCNTSAGGKFYEKAQVDTDSATKAEDFDRSLAYLGRALEIYPGNKNALLLLGNVYGVYQKDYKKAIKQYLQVIHLEGYNDDALRNTLIMLERIDNTRETDYKISVCRSLYVMDPQNARVNALLGNLYGQFKGNFDSAVIFLERSVSLAPEEISAYKDLGVIYGMRKDYENALRVFRKASEVAPGDQQIQQNLAITYQLLSRKGK